MSEKWYVFKSDECILDECFKNELLTFETRIYFVLYNV